MFTFFVVPRIWFGSFMMESKENILKGKSFFLPLSEWTPGTNGLRNWCESLFEGMINDEFDNLISFIIFFFSLNLYELIKKNNYQGFSLSLIRRFCNSIVKCLRLLYHENIIHCDLKPVN